MRLEKEAELLALNANIGSALTKSQVETHLAGAGANAKLLGIYFSGKRQHIDLRTVQFHEAPKATSLLLYKGAVKENAHAIYQGLIKVHKDAQQTDAYQSNKNLVLNDKARADSIPSLEIEANDVKCSHGATVGRVNKEELFYLMSRGISFPEAQRLIISGFFEDVLKEAPEDIQEELRQQIENELGD
jgi:Fe-S cluster assembly protein SufD